jgi:hypothetical protein
MLSYTLPTSGCTYLKNFPIADIGIVLFVCSLLNSHVDEITRLTDEQQLGGMHHAMSDGSGHLHIFVSPASMQSRRAPPCQVSRSQMPVSAYLRAPGPTSTVIQYRLGLVCMAWAQTRTGLCADKVTCGQSPGLDVTQHDSVTQAVMCKGLRLGIAQQQYIALLCQGLVSRLQNLYDPVLKFCAMERPLTIRLLNNSRRRYDRAALPEHPERCQCPAAV